MQPSTGVLTRNINSLVRAEAQALVAEQRAGDDAAWNAPTYCAGWAARDAVAHLLLGARLVEGATRAAMEDAPPPPFDH